MNEIVILLDKYKDSIQEVRGRLRLSPSGHTPEIYTLTMSMKHRIELIQHTHENIRRFDWNKLCNFDFFKNKEGKVSQELDGINVVFNDEKAMNNFMALSLLSIVTLCTALIDSLALLFNYSFYLGVEKYYAIEQIQDKIPIDLVRTKVKEEISENKDYRELKRIRKLLLHFDHSSIISYSHEYSEAGPFVRHAGVWCIKDNLLQGVDGNQRTVPAYCDFIYTKISKSLKDILTITLTPR